MKFTLIIEKFGNALADLPKGIRKKLSGGEDDLSV